jgi:hypothetical protein
MPVGVYKKGLDRVVGYARRDSGAPKWIIAHETGFTAPARNVNNPKLIVKSFFVFDKKIPEGGFLSAPAGRSR